ncbi:MAG: Asp-tRNA(Asn)/Glu-tRNA(Gln) amidotransferase subunit GatC [Planctomycetes bacterium]|nr:Asp-tRNA(Asn)/Glu-tRNA(Gln) amidotransferase subunit GatC [Planctomycetota bacterium]
MAIDRDTVRKVALLGRLDLDESSLERFQAQLGAILDYIDQLKKLDVAGVEPLAHAGDFANVFREDAPRPSLSTEEALRNAPESTGPFFVVPKIIE